MMRSRITVVVVLGLMLGAMPAQGALSPGESTCTGLYTNMTDALNSAGTLGVPLPALPSPGCADFAPTPCRPSGSESCRILLPGAYYVPGNLDLDGTLFLVGTGDFTLLVDGVLTVSGTVEGATAVSGLVPLDGSNVFFSARSIDIRSSGVVRAADGTDGRNVLAQGTGASLRGVDGGQGGNVLLAAAVVRVDGALVPGEGGQGGDALGLLGMNARGGDGGAGGVAVTVTPSGVRLVAGGSGGDGGAAYSMGDATVALSMNPCPDCAPTTQGETRCGGRWCLASTEPGAETCVTCVVVGGPTAEGMTCAVQDPFCVLPPLNVDTGPLGDGAGGIIGWLWSLLPATPRVPDDLGPSDGVCALVYPCEPPSPPPLPNPNDIDLPPLPAVPRGPYCALGMCFLLGELPSGGPVVPPVEEWVPEGPYCIGNAQWEICVLSDDDPTQVPPPPPPPVQAPNNPCDILVSCQFWESITSLTGMPIGGVGGVPVQTTCGAPARGGDGTDGWSTDGGHGGSATSHGCTVNGKRGEDGKSNVLLVSCTNGEPGTDGVEGAREGRLRAGTAATPTTMKALSRQATAVMRCRKGGVAVAEATAATAGLRRSSSAPAGTAAMVRRAALRGRRLAGMAAWPSTSRSCGSAPPAVPRTLREAGLAVRVLEAIPEGATESPAMCLASRKCRSQEATARSIGQTSRC